MSNAMKKISQTFSLPSAAGGNGDYKLEPTTGTYLTYFAMLAALLGVIIQLLGHLFQKDSFYRFGIYTLENLEEAVFIRYVLAASAIIGILSVFAGFFLGLFALQRRRLLVVIFLWVVLVVAILTTAFGAYLLYFLNDTDKQVQDAALTVSLDNENTLAVKLSDYTLALYAGCCEDKGLLMDPDDLYTRECFPNENEVDKEPGESCYRTEDAFIYFKKMASNNICNMLGNSTVSLKGVKIPQTSIEVKSLTDGQETVPLVGRSIKPVFGCGAGYPLAFQYAFYVWFSQQLRPLAITAVAFGGIEIVLLLFACTSLSVKDEDYIVGGEETAYLREDREDFVEKRMRQKEAEKRQRDRMNQKRMAETLGTQSPNRTNLANVNLNEEELNIYQNQNTLGRKRGKSAVSNLQQSTMSRDTARKSRGRSNLQNVNATLQSRMEKQSEKNTDGTETDRSSRRFNLTAEETADVILEDGVNDKI